MRPAIVALIDDLMPFLTLHPNGEGAEKFIEHCRLPAIEHYLSQSRYAYQLAHIDGDHCCCCSVIQSRPP